MLGQARSKFATIAGPGSGGMQLNGKDLISEAKEDFDRLEKEIVENVVNGSSAYTFVIG
jgi:hypothetical protein